MAQIRVSTDIARPVTQVVDTVADQRNNPTMTASTRLSGEPIEVGTDFRRP